MTDIIRADIAIIALQRLAALALARVAEIVCCAQAPVFARIAVVESEHATALLIARVVCAGILVVADSGLASANILFTDVCGGAGIAVIAGHSCLRLVVAAALRIAGVQSALVVVIAVERCDPQAFSGHADVHAGAGITVVADDRVECILAETRCADVVGTRVQIIALGIRRALTHPFVDTANAILTVVIGASVAVIADQRLARRANAVLTSVVLGALVAVVARRGIVNMETAIGHVAPVVRADIAVVADVRLGHTGLDKDVWPGVRTSVIGDSRAICRSNLRDISVYGRFRVYRHVNWRLYFA